MRTYASARAYFVEKDRFHLSYNHTTAHWELAHKWASSLSGALFNCNLAHFSLVFFPIFVTYLGISLQKVQQKCTYASNCDKFLQKRILFYYKAEYAYKKKGFFRIFFGNRLKIGNKKAARKLLFLLPNYLIVITYDELAISQFLLCFNRCVK